MAIDRWATCIDTPAHSSCSRRSRAAPESHAPLVSVETAIHKAYAAAAIGIPPDDFYAAIESDGAAVAEFAGRPGLALIAGGLPVVHDGRPAGAVGVAGAMTGAEDRRIAEAASAEAMS